MGGTCSTHKGDEKCLHNLGGKLLSEGPLGRPRRIWGMLLKWILGK
jgi:hypothetical protein